VSDCAPVFDDGTVRLYVGDAREIVRDLELRADVIVTDPPYASTSLMWDRWQDGWPNAAALASSSMWCFGTLKMFIERAGEFCYWKLGHDIVWQKHNGSGFQSGRFRRIHESAMHFYRGEWSEVYAEQQMVAGATAKTVRTKTRPPQTGHIERTPYRSFDGGPKQMTSVIPVASMHGKAVHPTQKPLGILAPLIRYSCPFGGMVGDLFAGSGSTLIAARREGRRAWGIEADPEFAKRAVERLAQCALRLA
jgi:site-specific DNA-methyltransferase (adenine-specific)